MASTTAWLSAALVVTSVAKAGCSEQASPEPADFESATDATRQPDRRGYNLVHFTDGADYWGERGRPLDVEIRWPGPFTWEALFTIAEPLTLDGKPWGSYVGMGMSSIGGGPETVRLELAIDDWATAKTELFRYFEDVGLPKSAFFLVYQEDEPVPDDGYEYSLIRYGFQSRQPREQRTR